jgi:hypothetical protein
MILDARVNLSTLDLLFTSGIMNGSEDPRGTPDLGISMVILALLVKDAAAKVVLFSACGFVVWLVIR